MYLYKISNVKMLTMRALYIFVSLAFSFSLSPSFAASLPVLKLHPPLLSFSSRCVLSIIDDRHRLKG